MRRFLTTLILVLLLCLSISMQAQNGSTFTCGTSTVSDYDGNVYNTVQIGYQCWMKENLRTTHYADGTSIPLKSSENNVAYRYYPLGKDYHVSIFGYTYSWKAVTRGVESNNSGQGICPAGWHVPSAAEWDLLESYVGSQSKYACENSSSSIAKALSSKEGWMINDVPCTVGHNQSSNNATGFSALPIEGGGAFFWTTTPLEEDSNYICYRQIEFDDALVHHYEINKNREEASLSVRCLRY